LICFVFCIIMRVKLARLSKKNPVQKNIQD
jgi:hypothetical protein